MKRHVLTESMATDAANEADRYLNNELHEFYEQMKAKHGDVDIASAIMQASLLSALGLILKAEAMACAPGPLSDRDKRALTDCMNQCLHVINAYRADIRNRASGSLN